MIKYSIVVILFTFFGKEQCPSSYKLISKPKTITGCGGVLVAGEFLFINTKDSRQMIGIIKCPDGYGDTFFKEDGQYLVEFAKDTLLSSDYSLMNSFENSNKKIEVKIIEKIELQK